MSCHTYNPSSVHVAFNIMKAPYIIHYLSFTWQVTNDIEITPLLEQTDGVELAFTSEKQTAEGVGLERKMNIGCICNETYSQKSSSEWTYIIGDRKF